LGQDRRVSEGEFQGVDGQERIGVKWEHDVGKLMGVSWAASFQKT
jgi:hypothetical protein